MSFTIKRGDTSPALRQRLVPSQETQNHGITGYNAVKFFMRDASTYELIVSATDDDNITIIDAEDGAVEYQWQPGDTSKSGIYEAEWEVTYFDNSVETFPNDGYVEIEILEDLG